MADRIPVKAPDSEVVGDLVLEVARDLRRAVIERLEVPGVTPGRLRALRHLARSEAPVRIGELADALGMVPRSATTVVDELAMAGLVRRRHDPADRRATLVEMTSRGQELLAEARQVRRSVIADTFADLSGAEIAQLRSLLEKALPPGSSQSDQSE
jgi:DNA-binding MarR family transcriptional regulator